MSPEALLRELAPQVLAALVRHYGRFDACEDAVQEALLAAIDEWAQRGTPTNPRGWLIRVASRRLTDQLRRDQARQRRERTAGRLLPPTELLVPGPEDTDARIPDRDDTLTLLYLCCHPVLSEASQIALTLRAVCGLTTAQIAGAYLVPETTMSRRITRAKQQLRAAGGRFELPPAGHRAERLGAVLHVLYLVFNEGYAATSGPTLHRSELTTEAIRLTRAVHRELPADGEVAGLLALMLLTEARAPARVGPDGALIPLAEQDRSRWDWAGVQEGTALITHALAWSPLGPYQLQAAIAAVHAEAPRADATDWPQILALYQLLEQVQRNPAVTLNRAVAVAMVRGPKAGLELMATLGRDERMARHHRFHAVRAQLRELAGDLAGARADYRLAAELTASRPEREYLVGRAAGLPPP